MLNMKLLETIKSAGSKCNLDVLSHIQLLIPNDSSPAGSLDGVESPLVSASVLEPKLKVKELVFPVPTPEELPNKKVPVAAFGSNENDLAADVLSAPKMLVTDEAVVDVRPNENPPFGITESQFVNKNGLIVVVVGVAEVDVFEMGIPKLYLTGSGVPTAATPKVKSLCPVVI